MVVIGDCNVACVEDSLPYVAEAAAGRREMRTKVRIYIKSPQGKDAACPVKAPALWIQVKDKVMMINSHWFHCGWVEKSQQESFLQCVII